MPERTSGQGSQPQPGSSETSLSEVQENRTQQSQHGDSSNEPMTLTNMPIKSASFAANDDKEHSLSWDGVTNSFVLRNNETVVDHYSNFATGFDKLAQKGGGENITISIGQPQS